MSLVLLGAALLGPARARADAPLGCPAAPELQVALLVNAERTSRGLAPLDVDVRLMEAAQLHSDDMAGNDFVSHVGSNGATFDARIGAAGYLPWSFLGENIAAGQPTPEAVVAAWMASPGHRSNLLHPDFQDIGVGHAYEAGTVYGHYWTQDFGATTSALASPADLCPECSDTVDNDGDGAVDHPADGQCPDGSADRERAASCGLGFELAALVPWLARMRRRARCTDPQGKPKDSIPPG